MELAEKLQVSRQAVSKWEAGAAAPSTENLKCLRDLYGISVDALLDDGADLPDGEEAGGKQPKERAAEESPRRKWPKEAAAAVCVLAVIAAVLVCILVFRGKEDTEIIPIDEMKRGVIEVLPENEFDLEW